MIAGIVLFAVGVKKTLGGVDAELQAIPATALCVGTAMYLLALSFLKRLNYGSFNRPRLLLAAILVALAPIATVVPALLSLTLVAVATSALVAYEVERYAAARDRIRHGS